MDDGSGVPDSPFGPDWRSLALKSSSTRQGVVVVDIETGQGAGGLDEAIGTNVETSIILGTPTWSPDGRAVLIARTDKQGQDLRWIPVASPTV